MQQRLVVIQCDSGHLYSDLIACARHRMYDLMARGDEDQITHVLFIIHLPRQLSCSLVGFQGDPWISCHIDDLMPSEADSAIELDQVLGETLISDLFMGSLPLNEQNEACKDTNILNSQENINGNMDIGDIEQITTDSPSDVQLNEQGDTLLEDDMEMGEQCEESETWDESPDSLGSKGEIPSNSLVPQVNPNRKPFYKNLYKCIQPAASKLKDITMKRSTERVNILVGLIPKDIQQFGEFIH